jgi:predicted AAA+ superfamily ATPase
MNESLERMLHRAELLMARIERILPQPLHAPDWQSGIAFRYRKRSSGHGVLEPVRHIGQMSLDDLKEIDQQKEKIQRNTLQFIDGKPANNVLLTGARGTGKSSLLGVLSGRIALDEGDLKRRDGLRVISVDQEPQLPAAATLRQSLLLPSLRMQSLSLLFCVNCMSCPREIYNGAARHA